MLDETWPKPVEELMNVSAMVMKKFTSSNLSSTRGASSPTPASPAQLPALLPTLPAAPEATAGRGAARGTHGGGRLVSLGLQRGGRRRCRRLLPAAGGRRRGARRRCVVPRTGA